MLPRVDRLSLVDSQAVSRWGDERAARERMESPGLAADGADLVSGFDVVVNDCGLQRNELAFAEKNDQLLAVCLIDKGDAAAVAVNVDLFERLTGEVDSRSGFGADVH